MTVDWADVDLTEEHAELLAAKAITPEIVDAYGIRTILDVGDLPEGFEWAGERAVPSILFPWTSPSGLKTWQLKLDEPFCVNGDKRPRKYLQAKGPSVIGEIRSDNLSDLVLIVEGTKQALVAAAYSTGCSVYAVASCRNWQSEGVPSADLFVVDGKRVVVVFDGDVATNHDVWEAAQKLGEALTLEGATEVAYASVAAGGTNALDDVLGTRSEARRSSYVKRLIEGAGALPKEPKVAPAKPSAPPNPYIDPTKGGLQADKIVTAVLESHPSALSRENKVAIYRDGRYQIDGLAFINACSELLGDHYRRNHRVSIEEMAIGRLAAEDRYLPVHIDVPLMNVRNGMVDLTTGELLEHSPDYMSSMQFPIEWSPEATCPIYEAWLEEVIPDQANDLEEIASQMLDPSRTPAKAVFLFGPSRSGKSTFLRLLAAVAGQGNVSAVTLHHLSTDKFAAANVFAKALNAAADLSSAHVDDLSIFKMMTGEDLIAADRKYGAQFTFTNRALFAFSANELPTVGEGSRAYTERIKPFHFKHSFAGNEDPALEVAIMEELPGILRRWVQASQRLRKRGSVQKTHASVAREFEVRSDRVRQFVAEEMRIVAVSDGACVDSATGLTKRQLSRMFNAWAIENGGHKMAERKVIDRLTSINGVVDVRIGPEKVRGLNVSMKPEGDQDSGIVAEVDHPALYEAERAPLARMEENGYRKDGVKTATLPSDLNDRQKKLGRTGRIIVEAPVTTKEK